MKVKNNISRLTSSGYFSSTLQKFIINTNNSQFKDFSILLNSKYKSKSNESNICNNSVRITNFNKYNNYSSLTDSNKFIKQISFNFSTKNKKKDKDKDKDKDKSKVKTKEEKIDQSYKKFEQLDKEIQEEVTNNTNYIEVDNNNSIKNDNINKKENTNSREQAKLKYKHFFTEKYTEEEFNDIIKKHEDEVENGVLEKEGIELFSISSDNLSKLRSAKKISMFLNIPLSLTLTYLVEYVIKNSIKYSNLTSVFYLLDYFFFVTAIMNLHGLRHIVITAEYIPSKHTVIFEKLTWACKIYKVEHKVEDIERTVFNNLTPFTTLKSKKTPEGFSMTGTGFFTDHRFFNYLFPGKDLLGINKTEQNSRDHLNEKKDKKNSNFLWD